MASRANQAATRDHSLAAPDAEPSATFRVVNVAEAERLVGRRLDRRRRYAWDEDCWGIGPGLLQLARWVGSCSGCFEAGEYGGLEHYYPLDPRHGCRIGSGCDECGYTGKRRSEMWVPLTHPTPAPRMAPQVESDKSREAPK